MGCLVIGGAGGSRTHTLLRAEDFKSPASANSATAPGDNCSAAKVGVKGKNVRRKDEVKSNYGYVLLS